MKWLLAVGFGLVGCNGGDSDSGDSDTNTANSGPVVINEILASNATGLTDESGAYPDWLELYNTTNNPVDISGFTLTDDVGVDAPWSFVAGTVVPANGYIVVFCDGDELEGDLHTDFKLSATGETVTFADATGAVVDEVAFPAGTADISYGRLPDGGDTWGTIDPPTPNASN